MKDAFPIRKGTLAGVTARKDAFKCKRINERKRMSFLGGTSVKSTDRKQGILRTGEFP